MLLNLLVQLTDGFIASIDHNDIIIGRSRLYTPCLKDILDNLEVSFLIFKRIDCGKYPFSGLFLHMLGKFKKVLLERGRKLLAILIVIMKIFHHFIYLILNRDGYLRVLSVLCEVV